MSEIERKLNELIAKFNLDEYTELLRVIISDIYENGCLLYFREDNEKRSSHSRNESKCYIRISLRKDVYKFKEYIIWIILHEYGHHFQNNTKEDRLDKSKLYSIEKNAWELAELKFMHFGFSPQLKNSFLECRDIYLKTYE